MQVHVSKFDVLKASFQRPEELSVCLMRVSFYALIRLSIPNTQTRYVPIHVNYGDSDRQRHCYRVRRH
jgi:hypothetical protein